VDELAAGVRAGDRALLGRAITLVESNRPDHRHQAQELLSRLLPFTGAAHRVGLSGVPGAGKSTFIESFGCRLVDQGHRVAVLAVDPSSSRSKGSILGDKTRMERLAGRDEAFIRPSPSGGSLGGVGRKTRETILVCEAAGFDVILVETVGVGQSETLVAEMVDVFVVLMLAGAGDELQGIKRGILELADVLAINKADGDRAAAAERARVETERALSILRPPGHEPWSPRVVTCSALEEIGLDAIWDLVAEHRQTMAAEGLLDDRRRRQQLEWMWAMVDEQLRTSVREHPRVSGLLDSLEDGVLSGTVTPTHAALEILSAFLDRR
jgi:LAO/AO transport system kinase